MAMSISTLDTPPPSRTKGFSIHPASGPKTLGVILDFSFSLFFILDSLIESPSKLSENPANSTLRTRPETNYFPISITTNLSNPSMSLVGTTARTP